MIALARGRATVDRSEGSPAAMRSTHDPATRSGGSERSDHVPEGRAPVATSSLGRQDTIRCTGWPEMTRSTAAAATPFTGRSRFWGRRHRRGRRRCRGDVLVGPEVVVASGDRAPDHPLPGKPDPPGVGDGLLEPDGSPTGSQAPDKRLLGLSVRSVVATQPKADARDARRRAHFSIESLPEAMRRSNVTSTWATT